MADGLATITVDNNISFKRLEDGRTEICFIADKSFGRSQYALRDSLNTAGDKLTLKLTKYRKHRSLDANAYFWQLVTLLAEELGSTKEDIYREYIKHYGVSRPVEINEKAVDTMIYIWQSHGLGWFAERLDHGNTDGFVLLNFYYGSSSYNTKQMSRLIDAAVNDCKEQGIETLPPEEIKAMVEAYERKS